MKLLNHENSNLKLEKIVLKQTGGINVLILIIGQRKKFKKSKLDILF